MRISPARFRNSLLLAWCFGISLGLGAAAAPKEPDPPASDWVGERGRKDSLVLEGNKTFTREQIVHSLFAALELHAASRPSAPVGEYAAVLKRMITLGYQRAGFPEVAVETRSPDPKRMVVQIQEGPRYDCGEISLAAPASMTNAAIPAKIKKALLAEPAPESGLAGLPALAWRPGRPASLDQFAQLYFAANVNETLASFNYYQPTVHVRLEPNSATHRAELKIDIVDEGVHGTVAEIAVTGLHTNSRATLLKFLELKPGMPLQATLTATISNQLWRCGRFFQHDVTLEPLSGGSQFKLKLDVDEVPDAPPLGQEFSPQETALLNARDQLAAWEHGMEDLAVSITSSELPLQFELVLSPTGFAFVARNADPAGAASMAYALAVTDKLTGFYSAWRKSKFTSRQTDSESQVLAHVRPPSPQSYGNGNITLGLRVGLPHEKSPLRIEWDLAPAVFVSMAHWMESSREGDIMTFRDRNEGGTEVRLHAPTGRLLEARAGSSNEYVMSLRFEEGAFGRLSQELARLTADFTNRYVPNRGFDSWVSYVLTEVTESPLAQQLFERFGGGRAGTNSSPTISAAQSLVSLVKAAREIVRQENSGQVFDPLKRLFGPESDEDETEDFVLPRPPSNKPAQAMAGFSAWALNSIDLVYPGRTWPSTMLRAAAFALGGETTLPSAELGTLLKSNDLGPVGCLAAAYLAASHDLKLARAFAQQGQTQLARADLKRDFDALLQPDSMVGEIAANALALFRRGREDSLNKPSGEATPIEITWLIRLLHLLQETKEQSPAQTAWPLLAALWDDTIRRHVEAGLQQFLPQVQFLTNSQALYERGLQVKDPGRSFQDFEEAAQCFRKAAAQGHPGAALQAGLLYEHGTGVSQDFDQAMRYYRQAAEKKEPHSACSLGGLYSNGKGVPQDAEQAAHWFRIDAEHGCVRAQFELGQILEQKNQSKEALQWYRRAAEVGATPAQAKLGELLSDGIFVPADPVEACQWLILAADSPDRLASSRLRRAKSKLTPQQIDEAETRADAVRRRIKQQEKEKEQKEKI